ncbi:MAG: hypothetical protein RL407_1793 [Bacteroidota bacterium]|jgi:signal transduction histidine kinase
MKPLLRSILLLGGVFVLPILLILNFFVFQKSQEEHYVEAIESKLHEVENQFEEDFQNMQKEVGSADTLSAALLTNGNYAFPFFIVSPQGQLLFWSDFSFTLEFSSLDPNKEYQVLDDPNGTFLIKINTWDHGGIAYTIVQAYRLIWPGTIKNDYLATGPNPEVFGNDQFTLYPNPEEGSFQISSSSGDSLFGIDFNLGYVSVGKTLTTPLFIFSCSIFLLYFLLSFNFLRKKWRKGQVWQAIGYGFLILCLVRVGMLLGKFPQAYIDLPLFESSEYSSGWLIPSLGDLLLHVLGFSGIFGLVVYQLSSSATFEKFVRWKDLGYQNWVFLLGFLSSSLFFFLLLWISRDFMLHAQWMLDSSTIASFDLFKGIGFFILFLWAAMYVFLCLCLIQLMRQRDAPKQHLYKFLALASIPLIILLFLWGPWMGIAALVHLLFLLAILRFDLYTNVFRLGLETFLTLFFASLMAAVLVATSGFHSKRERLIHSKREFAEQNLVARDEMTLGYLEDIFSRLKNDLFVQNRLGDPLLSKEPIVTKIKKIYLDNYFDQFDLEVRVFSTSGRQIAGPTEIKNWRTLQQEYIKSDYATRVKDLYFLEGDETTPGNKYVSFIPILQGDNILGYIFLALTQVKIQSESAYPRLLLDKKYAAKLDNIGYDYGVFRQGELVRSAGTYNYQQKEMESLLSNPKLLTAGVVAQGYHHLGLVHGEDLIVLSSPSSPLAQFFSTISMFFVVFVFLTFISILLGVLFQGYKNLEFNYSTKLQLYLNFAFFFPIIIISLITTGVLTQSYRDDLNAQYIQKASLIKGNLLRFFSNQEQTVDKDALTEEINTLANTIGSDIHLYSEQGTLEVSSRPTIFEKKILSTYIHPQALAGIQESNLSQILVDEKIGKLQYQTVYLSLPSQGTEGNFGILAIPFFESEEELNALISGALGNVFNAFVIIFILFLMVSFLVTKHLTLPFRLLTQKLKTTDLEDNVPMYWTSKDEIGMLVNEYNNMLAKLEASKKVLASTEKESAWREMAKQVAHEIKNPLTPMKLTLQHLLRLQKEGQLEDDGKLKKSLETLIHQVDALSGIASSFSTFAKMPLPSNELINFKEVVTRALELFKPDKRLDLVFQDDSFSDQIPILGDDKLFGRVIANLIINGMQAVEAGKRPQIRVWLWMNEEAVFLEISDNGKGIPVELRDKIFIPNFSTKSQGSGLGLAIAKSGVETAGGKIWFETELGKGSTFFLTFPLQQTKTSKKK